MKREDLVTINEAAEIKGVSRQAIHAAIRTGRLGYIEVTTIAKRIEPKALAAFKINPNMQLAGRKPKRRNGGRPRKVAA